MQFERDSYSLPLCCIAHRMQNRLTYKYSHSWVSLSFQSFLYKNIIIIRSHLINSLKLIIFLAVEKIKLSKLFV